MNTILKISLLILSISLISCKKEIPPPPDVTTLGVTDITATSAVCSAELDYSEGLLVGVECWTTPDPSNPLISVKITNNDMHPVPDEDSFQGDRFSCEMTGLTPGTQYWVVAHVRHYSGITKYGEVIVFTTPAE
ncbi:MAG: fibronectin type III domain-containing protein [Bacteroidales bacterium]|jgi:hypothetical protein|nr:fibronectin type III domain-containing protein [Bacteroidales bacterium]